MFHHQLVKKGERILFDPGIQVYHHHRTRFAEFLRHQMRIGVVTAKVLKKIDLEGSYLAKRPVLATILAPLICIVKFVRTINVFWRVQPQAITERPLVLFPFCLGLIFWAVGFAQGAWKAGDQR